MVINIITAELQTSERFSVFVDDFAIYVVRRDIVRVVKALKLVLNFS